MWFRIGLQGETQPGNPQQPQGVPDIAVCADAKCGPAGIGDEMVFFGEIFLNEEVADGAREWDVEEAPGVDVADLGIADVELLGFELMPTDGDARPSRDDFF